MAALLKIHFPSAETLVEKGVLDIGGVAAEPVGLREDPGGDGADAGEGTHFYQLIKKKSFTAKNSQK